MKDNLQNIADLIGALAEDIEEEEAGRKGQPGQGRGIRQAGKKSGACCTLLQWQCSGKYQCHFREQGSHWEIQAING